MKIKQFPGKAIMDDPWMAMGDRTMEMVYAANWVDTHRHLAGSTPPGSWEPEEDHLPVTPNYDKSARNTSIARSKSCRDVARPSLKDFESNESEYAGESRLNGTFDDMKISQLAKYQNHIEEQTRASNEIISSQRKLQPSFSFKGFNGYKPSTLRRIKRRQYKEWDVDENNESPPEAPATPQRRDSKKYLQRQRKHDAYDTPSPPDMTKHLYSVIEPDPNTESYYDYYSRLSQQEASPPKHGGFSYGKKSLPLMNHTDRKPPTPAPRTTAPSRDSRNGFPSSSSSGHSSASSSPPLPPPRSTHRDEVAERHKTYSPTDNDVDYRKSIVSYNAVKSNGNLNGFHNITPHYGGHYGDNSESDDNLPTVPCDDPLDAYERRVLADKTDNEPFSRGKSYLDTRLFVSEKKVNGNFAGKPANRSKSLRLKSDSRPLAFSGNGDERFIYDDVGGPMAHGVTVTQPKRTISPIEQVNLMQSRYSSESTGDYTEINGLHRDAFSEKLINSFHAPQRNGIAEKVVSALQKKIKNPVLQKYNTVRVKSYIDDRPNGQIGKYDFNPRGSENGGVVNGDAGKPRSSSSGGDSDSDFSIPRPKLIVPVHTYGIRKRRTGNLTQAPESPAPTLPAPPPPPPQQPPPRVPDHHNGYAENKTGIENVTILLLKPCLSEDI